MCCPEIFETICYNKHDHFIAKIVKQSIQNLPLLELQFSEKEGAYFHRKWRVRIVKMHHDEVNVYPPDYVYDIGWKLYGQAKDFEKECENYGTTAKIIYCGDYYSDTTKGIEQENVILRLYFNIEGLADSVRKLRVDSFADNIVACLRMRGLFATRMS